ncbi:MAG: hypothetical protein JNL21_35655 [Myxococcales bacterium]|nr:hypothetical protein [Myxococcales bacterium]
MSTASSVGHAQVDAKSAARTAYARGERAAQEGNLREAALAFDEADRLAPNTVALESAIGAAVRADDPLLVMQIVARAEGTGRGELAVVAEARDAFERRVATFRFPCLAEKPACAVVVDGAARAERTVHVLPGSHRVEVTRGDRRSKDEVNIAGGEARTFDPPVTADPPVAPAPPPASSLPPSSGLSPYWLILGAGVTVGFAAGTVATGVLALEKQSELDTLQCRGVSGPCSIGPAAEQQAVIDDGERFELMAGVFGGITVAAAITTVLVGALAVEWDDAPATVAFTAGPGLAGLVLGLEL